MKNRMKSFLAILAGLVCSSSLVSAAGSSSSFTAQGILNGGNDLALVDLSRAQQQEFGFDTATTEIGRLRDSFERSRGTSALALAAQERARVRLVTAGEDIAAATLGQARSRSLSDTDALLVSIGREPSLLASSVAAARAASPENFNQLFTQLTGLAPEGGEAVVVAPPVVDGGDEEVAETPRERRQRLRQEAREARQAARAARRAERQARRAAREAAAAAAATE